MIIQILNFKKIAQEENGILLNSYYNNFFFEVREETKKGYKIRVVNKKQCIDKIIIVDKKYCKEVR